MRHRIKKIPTLSKLDHLLHSDESTYFYNKGLTCSTSIPLLVSICGLLLVLGMMISPLSSASGVDKASAIGQDYGAGRTVSLTILNDNGSEVGDGDTISTTLETPGQVAYISSTLRINTNRIAKYYVGVQAAEDGTSDLIGSTGETITGVGDEVSPDDFGDNTWGYSLTDNTTTANNQLTYSTLPAYKDNSPLQYTSPMNPTDGNHDLKLAFAARINANRPSGHYTTKAMVSVAADPKTLTLSDITYMQDMMPDICASTPEHSTKQLIDKRDDKSYWVTKLKDGNCWMTQNLDLDLSTEVPLKPETSDVKNEWTPPTTTSSGDAVIITDGSSPNESFDSGMYVYTLSETPVECGSAGVGIKNLGQCTDKGWVKVDGMSASSDPNFASIVDTENQVYNAHYLSGNYYSQNIATVGETLTIGDGSTSTQSICPKGWKLPLGGFNTGDFVNLFASYGWAWQLPNGYFVSHNLSATLGGATYDFDKAPLYFLMAGAIDSGPFVGASGLSTYWTATSGYRFLTYHTEEGQQINPSEHFTFTPSENTVRCVAR